MDEGDHQRVVHSRLCTPLRRRRSLDRDSGDGGGFWLVLHMRLTYMRTFRHPVEFHHVFPHFFDVVLRRCRRRRGCAFSRCHDESIHLDVERELDVGAQAQDRYGRVLRGKATSLKEHTVSERFFDNALNPTALEPLFRHATTVIALSSIIGASRVEPRDKISSRAWERTAGASAGHWVGWLCGALRVPTLREKYIPRFAAARISTFTWS